MSASDARPARPCVAQTRLTKILQHYARSDPLEQREVLYSSIKLGASAIVEFRRLGSTPLHPAAAQARLQGRDDCRICRSVRFQRQPSARNVRLEREAVGHFVAVPGRELNGRLRARSDGNLPFAPQSGCLGSRHWAVYSVDRPAPECALARASTNPVKLRSVELKVASWSATFVDDMFLPDFC